MDTKTEERITKLYKRVKELEAEIDQKDEAIRALTGELIKKNVEPDYLVAVS